MIFLETAIQTLTDHEVEFVIVGGVAVKIHSSSYVTVDLDFCYSRSTHNLTKIVTALAPYKPRPREFPPGLPYFFELRSLQGATNFTFETGIGDIDMLGEIEGIGDFAAVKRSSEEFFIFERAVQVLSVNGLIAAKRAAGRPKDLLVLPELEALQELLSDQEEDDEE